MLFRGSALFSPSVPVNVKTAWTRNGGTLSVEDRDFDWVFCTHRRDPWVERYNPMETVVFSADWVTTCVRERFPMPLSPFVLNDAISDNHPEEVLASATYSPELESSADLTLIDADFTDLVPGSKTFITDLFKKSYQFTPPKLTQSTMHHSSFHLSVSTSTRRPFYSTPARADSSSPLARIEAMLLGDIDSGGRFSEESEIDEEDERRVDDMLLDPGRKSPYLPAKFWDTLQIGTDEETNPTFDVESTLAALDDVSLANVALFAPNGSHPDLRLPFIVRDPGRKLAYRRA